ncbi:uncharacterized protein LOC124438376 [Xenia sp. Carnegie-2017]|uniref:uncharacterized protein LOC124438376 n=1 Tax=Xenia sp. Carnegie-2017 TaxID=2897299 RepID=UPI001F041F3E|nr:uncharacterized protein LOC124438376 [Xenia sp. Carnegie-2017]
MSSADFETVGNSGLKIPTSKVIPPNVTVFRQPSTSETYIAPITAGKSQGIKSPVIKTPPSVKCPERRSPINEADSSEKRFQVSKQSVDFPSSKSDDDNEPVSSRSNFISIMKTTLGEKPSKENVQPNTKRKNLDSTSDGEGPPAKKNGKSTIFTPLNEHEAEKLANDIYDVNVEYFPIKTLAEKAAQREPQPVEPENVEKNRKVEEIDKVRCLLKDFYDITFSCTEDPDMKKFDTASRRFGRKNILNHLSLLDQYFNELQKKLSE